MSNLLSGLNARIRGDTSRSDSNSTPPAGEGSSDTAPPASEKPAETSSGATGASTISLDLPRPLPLWLNPAYAKHIVKGNFLALSTRPKTVEQGEWVAHQAVEHYRNLWHFVRVIHESEDGSPSICNPSTCPKMSAGDNHSYTWLNRNHEPVELPAREYMSLMQRWISSKIDDDKLFPTDPSGVSYAHQPDASNGAAPPASNGNDSWLGHRSGFPQQFGGTCQLIFRQIFRVYAHMYWAHYVDPFYHLNLEKELNSCFSHFIVTAMTLNMLTQDDIEPMKELIDMWAADGTFPPDSRAYKNANLERGKSILALTLPTAI